MHSKRIQSVFFAYIGFSFVLFSAAAQIVPHPTSTPIIGPPSTPRPINTPSPVANPDESIPVVINHGQGQETRVNVYRGVMQPVGLLPNQSVTVTLLFPASRAGTPVVAGLYDGGQVGAVAPPGTPISPVNAVVVAADGTLQFNFQPDQTSGLYRVLVTAGSSQYLLQFYAVKPGTAPRGPIPKPPPVPTPYPSPTPH
jgi:hypothetical protein